MSQVFPEGQLFSRPIHRSRRLAPEVEEADAFVLMGLRRLLLEPSRSQHSH